MSAPTSSSILRDAVLLPALALALACGALACGGGGPDAPPHVLVVVADTLRADRVGNGRGMTPFIDSLAARGTTFSHAYAASSWTRPSVASLFTSRYPTQHGTVEWHSVLPASEVTLAERLTDGGYRGLGFSANLWLKEQDGFGQGFAQWQMFMSTKRKPKVRGERLRNAVVEALEGSDPAQCTVPHFLYLQYMEPHSPYLPPEPFRARYQRGFVPENINKKLMELGWRDLSASEVDALEGLYDGEVAALDDQVRQLFEDLEPTGVLDNTIIVITSDHGEEFHEHGLMGHGFTLYDESIRVPLIVIAPGFAGGAVVDEAVSLVDVAPTLLDLAGLPPEPLFEGRSLVPLLARSFPGGLWAALAPRANAAAPAHQILAELEPNGGSADLREHSAAYVEFPRKLLIGQDSAELAPLVPDTRDIGGAGPRVFDLSVDPGEVDPNPEKLVAEIPELVAALDQMRATLGQRKGERQTAPIDESTQERLRALGYLE